MGPAYLVHIAAGGLSLAGGFVALYAAKGATVHRMAGTVFVYAMLATCVAGFAMAVVRGVAPAVNVPAALLTGYMVVTALTTLRPRAPRSRWVDVTAMLAALAVAATSLAFAFEAFANGGTRKGMPAFPFVLFPVLAVLVTMLYWLWRVRIRRSLRGVVLIRAAGTA